MNRNVQDYLLEDGEGNIINGKSRFLAYILHDIRIPVTGIAGMADIAIRDIDNKEKAGDCLSKIKDSSEYLLSLVDNILDIIKYSKGRFEREDKPFDITEFLGKCICIFEELLCNRQIKFVSSYTGLPVEKVFGDELRLKQVLVNLFSNAIKYTSDGGTICFSVEEVRYDNESVTYCFVISDTGIGMSEEFIEEIFEPFSREKHNDNIKYEGNGLGMAIVKQFTDMLGGEIKVKSKKGSGTTFNLTITFDIDHSCTDKAKNSAEADFTGKNILVVDDSDINAEIICDLLKQRGANAYMETDGESAVKAFEMSGIDFYHVILMDVTMPIMNGIEATKLIRSLDRPDALTVPVFAMTGNVFKDDILKCREAGMDEQLIKPVDLLLLRQLMSKYNKV